MHQIRLLISTKMILVNSSHGGCIKDYWTATVSITTNQYFVIPLLLGACVMYRYRPLVDTVLGFVETVINLYDWSVVASFRGGGKDLPKDEPMKQFFRIIGALIGGLIVLAVSPCRSIRIRPIQAEHIQTHQRSGWRVPWNAAWGSLFKLVWICGVVPKRSIKPSVIFSVT